MMIRSFSCIVITSDEPYSKMWHTQLLYANYLSKENEVIYIEPPDRWNFRHLFLNTAEERKNGGVRIIKYLNRFPAGIAFFQKMNERINENVVRKNLEREGHVSVLIWHFDSYRSALSSENFTNVFKIKRVYHVIDPYYKNPLNDLLCRIANVVVLTSQRNNEHYSAYKGKLINIPQCIDPDRAHEILKTEIDVPFNNAYVVFIGTLSDDVDYGWLNHLCDNEVNRLVLIGERRSLIKSLSAFENLLSKKNVKHLGAMDPEQFYPVLKKAHAGLIIYDSIRRKKIFSPLKALNYLAAGIPVITNVETEIIGLDQHCIHRADDERTFMALAEKAMRGELFFEPALAENYLSSVRIDKAIEKITAHL
jgi:hypothetical protein